MVKLVLLGIAAYIVLGILVVSVAVALTSDSAGYDVSDDELALMVVAWPFLILYLAVAAITEGLSRVTLRLVVPVVRKAIIKITRLKIRRKHDQGGVHRGS